MKGQISFVEFIVSTTLFVLLVSYFSFQLLVYVPSYVAELKSERVRSQAYQLSELLINDFGSPKNWNSVASANRIGLSVSNSNRTNLVNSTKVSLLNSGCVGAGYDSVKKKLGSELNFSLVLTERRNNQVLLNCRPSIIIFAAFNTTIKRFFAINDTPAELEVTVWTI